MDLARMLDKCHESPVGPERPGPVATSVKDEVRHAQVAQMLADFYDAHQYRLYQQNPHSRDSRPPSSNTRTRLGANFWTGR